MRIKHHAGAVSLAHEGETYLADDEGYFAVPFEFAQTLLLGHHGWEAEEAKVYVAPEPEIVVPVTPVPPVEPEPELTPYQKGLLTRAANEAAKAAEAAKAK